MKIIDSYAALPVGKYLEILAVNKEDRDDIDKQVATIAILADVPEEDLLNLPLTDYASLAAAADFLRHEDKGTHKVADHYRLGGFDLVPVADPTKLTAGQYIDFQALTKEDQDTHLAQLLSVVLVPKGKKYGDGYDIAEVQRAIREGLSVTDALSVLAFFFVSLRQSIATSLTYSKRAAKGLRNKATRREMEKLIRETEATLFRTAGAGSLR